MKKIIVSVMVLGIFVTSSPVHALTLSDLQKEIEILKQEIASLKGQLSGNILGAITDSPATYTTYYFGMKSPGLIPLQQKLIDQKYLIEGSATGTYGVLTYNAVKNFQSANGLTADGVLGPKTQETLLMTGPELACAPNTWVKRKDFGGLGRQGPFGFSVGSKGYIGGGTVIDTTTGQHAVTADFWEYNSTTNTWAQKADFGGGKRNEAVGFSIGSKGYAGTGYWLTSTNGVRDTKDFWEYNPATNIWTKKADFGGEERDSAVGFSVGGKGYIGTGDAGSFSKDFWEYDPVADAWTRKADLAGEKRVGAVGFGIGSKGYIGTGDVSPANNIVLKDFWEFDPAANIWTQKSDFGGGAGANGAGFAFNNKGYIQMGADFQEYDPGSNTWTKKANFPLPYLLTQVGFAINNKGYIGGGNNGGTRTKDFWMYCPGISN